MTLDACEAIVHRVHSIDFAAAVDDAGIWDAMWRPTVMKFVDWVVPNTLELANMDERCLHPLAEKKISIFRS